jgi:hypothetical protein
MDLESLFGNLTDFYYSHTVVAIALGVVLLLLACFRPKAMLKTAGLLLALVVAAYFFTLFMDMAGSGRSQKKDLIETVR